MQTTAEAQFEHKILPKTSHDEFARQEFVRSYKEFLVKHVHHGNRVVYDRKVQPEFIRQHQRAPKDRFEVRDLMSTEPHYRMFSALLRTSQEMMWSSAQKPVEREFSKMLRRVAKSSGKTGGTLRLNPALEIPKYLTAVDIHCQPGGYHTETAEGDCSAGAVYDRAVHIYAMGQLGPYNDDMGTSLAEWLSLRHPDLEPKRILDLGCSVGHSTVPYARAFPDAEIHAVDVAAPMLRYAHARAEALGAKIHFSQQNAEKLDFDDGSFDLIVSHILLHETSEKAIHNIMHECYRLLRKGGLMVHAETPQYKGMTPFDAFMLDWDAQNNNEPFWSRSHEIDLNRLVEDAGFDSSHGFEQMIPSCYSMSEADRSLVFQGGDFGGGGLWFIFGATK